MSPLLLFGVILLTTPGLALLALDPTFQVPPFTIDLALLITPSASGVCPPN